MLSMSARDTTPIAPLMGEDQNSIIQVKTETRKDKGDSVTFSLLARLSGAGYSEGQDAVGNAEAMTLYRMQSSTKSATSAHRLRRTASTTSAFRSTSATRRRACSACGSASVGRRGSLTCW
jgi:hypothetical protein